MNNLISQSTIDALNNHYTGSIVKTGKDIAIAAGDSFFGLASIAKSVASVPAQYRENEFVRKLLSFLYNVDSITVEERQKVLCSIAEKSDDYVGNILLNLIDRIDHIEKINIMVNLFIAVAKNEIDGEMFLRLSTVLCYVPFVDLKHLSEYQKDIYQPCISETLFASGLIYQSVIDGGTSESSGTDLYHISHLGHQLAKYGMRLQLPEENLTAKTKDANGLTWESLGTVDDNTITSLFSK